MSDSSAVANPNKKVEGDLKNNLRAIRLRLGLSQSDLASKAGVARQTIGGIEASLYAPSAAVALKLSRALGCRVEDLFWLETEAGTLRATRAQLGTPSQAAENERVVVGRVGDLWVAHSLGGEAAFRAEMVPADGLVEGSGAKNSVEVGLLDSLDALERTVLIAGCAPALSLWTRSAQRWHPGLRATWIHANSTQALESLRRGEVHLAGLHLSDARGDDNTPFLRRVKLSGEIVLINFGIWDEGLLVPRDNPQQIRGVADLGRDRVRFLNREVGAGSRLLFDSLCEAERVPVEEISGYENCVFSHQAVARAISAGDADAGMGTAAMAQVFGLGFVPLRAVRFDFAVRAEFLKHEPVAQLFETLSHPSVRLQLQKLGGYDTARTGEIVARVGSSATASRPQRADDKPSTATRYGPAR